MARILLALHQFFPRFYTGTETLTLEVAKELQTRGHYVAIVCVEPTTPDYPGPEKPELQHTFYEGIPVWRIFTGPEVSLVERLEYESNDERLVPFIENILLKEKPDIVHAFHLMHLTLSFVEVVKRADIPFYFTTTDFWLLCPTFQLLKYNQHVCSKPDPLSCFKCLLALYMKGIASPPKSILLCFRFPRVAALLNSTTRSCQRILKERIKRNHRIFEMMDGVFWSNEFLQNIFNDNKYTTTYHNIIKFPVPQKANNLFELPLAQESSVLRVAFIGTLNPSKGPQVAIKAVTKLNPSIPVQLNIWGAAMSARFEEELRRSANMDSRIVFCGTFPQEQFFEVLNDIDVLVIPSLWYENTPLTALSALAARRILIASDLGGLSSLVDNGRNGYLFPPGDSLALSRILAKLAKDKSELSVFAENIDPPVKVTNYVDKLLLFYRNFPQ